MLQRHARERAQHEEQHELVRNKLRATQASRGAQQSELATCQEYHQRLQTEIRNLQTALQHAENSQQQHLLSSMEELMVKLNTQTNATTELLSELTEREKRLLTRNEKYEKHHQTVEKTRKQELQHLVKELQRAEQNTAASQHPQQQQQLQAAKHGRQGFDEVDALLAAAQDSRKQPPHLPPAPSAEPTALRTCLAPESAAPADPNKKLRQQLLEQEEQVQQQQLQEQNAQQELQTAELQQQQQQHHEQQSFQASLKQQLEAEHAQMKAAAEKRLQDEMAELQAETRRRLAEEEEQMQAAAFLKFEQQEAELQSMEQRVAQQRREMAAAEQALAGVKNKFSTTEPEGGSKKPRLGEAVSPGPSFPFQPGPVTSGLFWSKPLEPGLVDGPRTPKSPDPSPEPPSPQAPVVQLAATPKYAAQPRQVPELALAPSDQKAEPLVQKKFFLIVVLS